MNPDQITVRFFVHADTPVPDRRRAVTQTLTRLAASGVIDTYSLELWPKVVSLDAFGETSNQVLETYVAAQTWAKREGVSITPPFALRTDEWQMTGETERRLHTPNMCLVVKRGEDVVDVYPHQRDQEVQTIGDGLHALEALASVDVEMEAESSTVDGQDPIAEGTRPDDTRLDPIER